MKSILVSGLINIEVTLQVEGFPIPYFPVRYPFHGVNSTVSGVGYNVAKALTVLGDHVEFLSMTGRDLSGKIAMETLETQGIGTGHVMPLIEKTPHSVILFDRDGRRQINVDLKNIQETSYPGEHFEEAASRCSMAALCNINFSRPFLRKAIERGMTVATDVHAISSVDDDYNGEFMACAHILFMSDESLPERPESWVRRLLSRFGPAIVVVGLGAEGALMAVRDDHFMERIPAVKTRDIVNTIGAGDALFSSFIHFYGRHGDPYAALDKAMVFASYKIGESGAAEGFLDEKSLERLSPSPPRLHRRNQ
ncbi:MAG: carbohydrate kinase family protein [Candidatus Eremiobacteraeota bacterium]|nr:carbohydrate kinase family protein [Candidatus Eremiobacteraeota bacterium]